MTAVTQRRTGTGDLRGDERCTYTPAPNFNGTDTFTYTVSDGNGGTDTATVTVTVTPRQRRARRRSTTPSTVAEDSAATAVDVLANDTPTPDAGDDADGHGGDAAGANGTVTLHRAACVSYTPAANFNGTDSFTYTISDGNGGTDDGDGHGDGHAGERRAGRGRTTRRRSAEDSGGHGDRRAGQRHATPDTGDDADGDGGDASPANGTVTLHRAAGVHLHAGRRTSTAPTRFTYTVSDGNGGTDTATVTVTVTAVNDAPDRGRRRGDGRRGQRRPRRSTCWPTTPTPDAGDDADGDAR